MEYLEPAPGKWATYVTQLDLGKLQSGANELQCAFFFGKYAKIMIIVSGDK